jgi:pyruvate carboxylase subunit B
VKYFVSSGETVHEVDLGVDGVRWRGDVHHVELATIPGTTLRHLRVGDRGYRLAARRIGGIWHIEIGGRTLRVRVEDERTRAIRELTGEGTEQVGPPELRAPMPGLIARIEVEPGQAVEAGAGMVVIEAMKMQNELVAPADGVVASIEVEEGQTVDRDQLLVRLEREPGV